MTPMQNISLLVGKSEVLTLLRTQKISEVLISLITKQVSEVLASKSELGFLLC